MQEARSSGVLASACGVVLATSIILGGGTHSGFLSDAILQLVATPLLLLSLWHLSRNGAALRLRGALAFCAAFVLIPLLQLVPLPPALWTMLPGREMIVEAYALTGRESPWRPISVAPHATWLGFASLIVPLGVFLATAQLGCRSRRRLNLLVLAIGLVSVFLGLLQIAQGQGGSLRFFATTNPSDAVGFFANRNHFAALLYSLTLFAAAWAACFGAQLTESRGSARLDTPLFLLLIAGFAAMVALIGAQLMARSRAGLVLTVFALLGIWALSVRGNARRAAAASARLLAGAIGLALVFGMQFALYRALDRFDADPLADARIPFALTTIEAARAYMPFGSGAGTFVPVYQTFEELRNARGFYANRAHNDVLEVWLEAGMFALLLMGAFMFWLVRRSVALWRARPRPGSEIDLLLARSASLVLVLICAHSLVDYPLRTAAIMALFAFAAALMVEAPDDLMQPRVAESRRRPEPRRTDAALVRPTPIKPTDSPQPAKEDWSDMEWPEAWRAPPERSGRG